MIVPPSILQKLNRDDLADLTLVAIDGGGGAGKSTLAAALAKSIPGTFVVHMDDFYKKVADQVESDGDQNVNFDWHSLRDLVLKPLSEGRCGQFYKYHWETDSHSNEATIVPAKGIVIVEGVMSLRREIRDHYDYKIWIDCPQELRLKRGIERDGETSRELWMRKWLPSEERYFLKHSPQQGADKVLSCSNLDST